MTLILSAKTLDLINDITSTLCDYEALEEYELVLFNDEATIHLKIVNRNGEELFSGNIKRWEK